MTVVPFGAATIYLIAADAVAGEAAAAPREIATLPAGELDGIVCTGDGVYPVSSWGSGSVQQIHTRTGAVAEIGTTGEGETGVSGAPQVAVADVPSPADLGWDARRSRVLIPIFQENRLVIEPIGP